MSNTAPGKLHASPAKSSRRVYRLVPSEARLGLRMNEEQAPDLGPRDVLVRIEAVMPTQCNCDELDFGSSGERKLVGAFDGGAITSNGGAVLRLLLLSAAVHLLRTASAGWRP